MRLVKNLRVGTRLGAAFGLVAVLMGVAIGFGLWGQSNVATANEQVREKATMRGDALMAKFRTADFAGWQTGYAFDVLRGVPNATDDASGQRKSFLESTQEFRRDLDRLRADAKDPTEHNALNTIQASFDGYTAVDKRIIAGLRAGTSESIKQATDLASGESLQWMDKIIQDVDRLVSDVSTESATAQANAARAAGQSRSAILVAAAICLVLMVVLAVLVTRSVVARCVAPPRRWTGWPPRT
jgi:methyl-accepting chemotaxis protein